MNANEDINDVMRKGTKPYVNFFASEAMLFDVLTMRMHADRHDPLIGAMRQDWLSRNVAAPVPPHSHSIVPGGLLVTS